MYEIVRIKASTAVKLGKGFDYMSLINHDENVHLIGKVVTLIFFFFFFFFFIYLFFFF